MTTIRVDTEQLRKAAELMRALSQDAGGLSSRAWELTSNAPSYDGQFGPQVQAIGAEAASRIGALVALLAAREEYLAAKADAFDAADQAAVASFAAVLPPVRNLAELFGIPQWLLDIIVAMIPGGDLIDILAQLKNWVVGEEVDDLVICLAFLGLLMDLGYVEPTPGGEGGNLAAGALKAIAKQLPKGPLRDAFTKLVQAALKSKDEAARLIKTVVELAQRGKVFDAILRKNPKGLLELLEAGPDAVKVLLRYSDDVILKYMDEVASLPRGVGHSNFLQGLQVSELAQRYGVDIHLCGRLADTPAEQAFRVKLYDEAQDLIDASIAANPEKPLSLLEAQMQVAEKYGVGWFQVKGSSVGPLKDVDAFIHVDQWKQLMKGDEEAWAAWRALPEEIRSTMPEPGKIGELRREIAQVYGLDRNKVDFYTELEPIDAIAEGLPPGRYTIPDPKTNPVAGSVRFRPDGTIEHPPIIPADSPYRQMIEQEWGLPLWP